MFGLSLALGVMLTAGLVRRTFYIERRFRRAVCTAILFFAFLSCGLWASLRAGWLNGFSVFVIVALSWMLAWLATARDLVRRPQGPSFLSTHPQYWREHWRYAGWVLATSLIFQVSSQGYYWLVAGFVSTREVAELRAMYMMVAPVEQLFVAFSYLLLPRMALHYASGRIGDFVHVWKRYCWLVVMATTGMAIMVRLFGRPIVHRLYAGKYDGSIHLLFLCSLVPILTLIGNTMNDGLKAAERPNMVFYAYCTSGVATFIVGIPLVRHFGAAGAVYGMLVSAAAFAATLAVAFAVLIQRSPRITASANITAP
jgi:O-antigen/teichoic acid export membrane protein